MPFLKIWIHAVWATSGRQPLLLPHIRKKVFLHIKENGIQKGIVVDRVNGYDDHVHVLLSLSNDQSIARTIQLLKGESSFWINKNSLIPMKFQWQDEYYAASVSDTHLLNLRNYIDSQEEHHRKKTFLDEYEELIQEITATLPPVQV
ncbi:MAG: transposase [Cyclobacteriaceae bacterium]|nr:transposase [Cyclobacteriaceae bacterium]